MSLINWNDSLRLGHDVIDRQHQRLVDITNQLHASMLAGKSRFELGELLSELVSYTHYHFEFEEQLFRQHSYPRIAEHTAQHAYLSKRAQDFKERHDAGAPALSVELMEFLRDWLTNHISSTDREFVTYVTARHSPRTRGAF